MPELRKDPVLGRWVIIAMERARRPGNFVDAQKNVFTDTQSAHEGQEEIYAVKDNGGKDQPWKVRVVPGGTPLLKADAKISRRGKGLYDVLNGYGLHEIVIESPDPIANMADLEVSQIRLVIDTYVSRLNELSKDPSIAYAFVYKNYGETSGQDMGHSYSQILALPVIPYRIKEKLHGARRHFQIHERCVYTDMVRQEEKERSRLIVENEHYMAMTPFASRVPFEVLILPKRQNCDFTHGVLGTEEAFAWILKQILLRFKIGLNDPAYTFVLVSSPFRGKQVEGKKWPTLEEDFCWHLEITPRLTRVAGFEKGTGFYICPIPPEEMAEFLRTVEIK